MTESFSFLHLLRSIKKRYKVLFTIWRSISAFFVFDIRLGSPRCNMLLPEPVVLLFLPLDVDVLVSPGCNGSLFELMCLCFFLKKHLCTYMTSILVFESPKQIFWPMCKRMYPQIYIEAFPTLQKPHTCCTNPFL